MIETWAPIPHMDGLYEVSDQGRVRSIKSVPRILRHQKSNPLGHRKLDLFVEGRRCPCWVHRLVLEAFVGPCPPGHEVRHLDGDATNNRLENLAYGTHSENVQDTIRHGRHSEASKTHCRNGHPFSGENLHINAWSGQRVCLTCRREYDRARRERGEHQNLRPSIQARVDALNAEDPA